MFGHNEEDVIIGPDLVAGFYRFAVYLDAACVGCILNFGTANGIAYMNMQKLVDTDGRLAFVDFQGDQFYQVIALLAGSAGYIIFICYIILHGHYYLVVGCETRLYLLKNH
jgi:hypothetical protein